MTDNIQTITLVSGADMTSAQYRFVNLSSGKVVLSSDDGDAIGVLQNNPNTDEAAVVAISGVSKVKINASAGISLDANVSSAANGLAKTADTGARILGKLVNPTAGSANEIVSVLLRVQGHPSQS